VTDFLRWLATGIRLPLLLGACALALWAAGAASPYQVRLLAVAGIHAIAVAGLQLVFGLAGALSLAQGTFFGVGAYAAGLLAVHAGWPVEATVPAAVLAPTLLALLVGGPVLRLESHYFSLATLGVGQVVLLAVILGQEVTGGANGLPGVRGLVLFGWNCGRGWPLVLVVWSAAATVMMGVALIARGRSGLALAQLRADPMMARCLGLDVGALRLSMLVASAACAGLAGGLAVHSLRVVSPETLEFPLMVGFLTMAMVGGRGRASGAAVGALLLIHLPEWLRGFERAYLVVYGAMLLVAIVVAPEGLIGLAEQIRRRWWPEPPVRLPVALAPGADAPLSWFRKREGSGESTPLAGAGGSPRAKRQDSRQGTLSPDTPYQRPAGLWKPINKEDLLVITKLRKQFGGVVAVDGVSFSVAAGEIVGVIGANGSGKTTLVNLISGVERPDRGSIRFAGREIAGAEPFRIARAGLTRSFQSGGLPDGLTALEAVAVARLAGHERNRRLAERRARWFLDRAAVPPDQIGRRCDILPPPVRRRVELARALARGGTLLLLDEPAAGLGVDDRQEVATVLRQAAADGLAILVIEHDLDFLAALADRILCFERGHLIFDGPPAGLKADAAVTAAYFGGPVT